MALWSNEISDLLTFRQFNVNFVVIHRNGSSAADRGGNLLRIALASEPVCSVVLDGLLGRSSWWPSGNRSACAIPKEWGTDDFVSSAEVLTYEQNVPVPFDLQRSSRRKAWVRVSNGRYATQISSELLREMLAKTQADLLVVNAEPDLLAYREKVLLTAQGKVAGFRRVYTDSAEPGTMPSDWPHHIFVKPHALEQILADHVLPGSFSNFVERCTSAALRFSAIDVAGLAFDFETEEGLLNFCLAYLSRTSTARPPTKSCNKISPSSRLLGKVLLGKNVDIGSDTVVVGPTIICNDVKVGERAAIDSSIIFQGVTVQQNEFVQNRVVIETESGRTHRALSPEHAASHLFYRSISLDKREQIKATFRTWPWFSYVRTLKRITDILFATAVLTLFAPVTPLIALAIKLTSPGPVFYKDKRQGLYGKPFNCLKFRTMHTGADVIQEKLRVVSEVDGPQFKIDDDPRISALGRFLRDTYIDEIPQFINVLLGQMTVVGPRPSPESENILCPWWRDARLSVRPGITGLWQVCRTRQPGKDFQEWIHYDTEYVRNLSLRMDLWIFWRTAKKMLRNLVRQF